MFLKVQAAFRSIEGELDPKVKQRRDQEFTSYQGDSDEEEQARNFRSKRGSKKKQRPGSNDEESRGDQQGQHDANEGFKNWSKNFKSKGSDSYQEESFLRRYRIQHLRSKSNVPMSLSNFDRHGMQNLVIEEVKLLDRMPIPPFLLYAFILVGIGYISHTSKSNTGMNIQQLKRENLLKAMRKRYSERIQYDADTEVTPVEKITKQTKEYREVVSKKKSEEKQARKIIRQGILMGANQKQTSHIVDIDKVVNEQVLVKTKS